MESWAGPGNEATVVSCESTSAVARAARLVLSFVLGLLSLCSFCSAFSAARRTLVKFDFMFPFLHRLQFICAQGKPGNEASILGLRQEFHVLKVTNAAKA